MSDSVEQSAKIRILVRDDQPLLRHGISAYLNLQPDRMVCGEAEGLLNARSKIAQCQPQLLVSALRLGTEDSLKLIKKLKAEMPRLRILVYSALEESIFAERAMRGGASGYVMTQAPTDALASAIREIVRGGIYVSRDVALSAFRNSLRPRPKNNYGLRSAGGLEELSHREMQVFQFLASGLTNRQIAASDGANFPAERTSLPCCHRGAKKRNCRLLARPLQKRSRRKTQPLFPSHFPLRLSRTRNWDHEQIRSIRSTVPLAVPVTSQFAANAPVGKNYFSVC